MQIKLSETEIESLEKTFKATEDNRLRDRCCQAVLMSCRGRTQAQIAEDLLVNQSTVWRWLACYKKGGLDGLVIKWAQGSKGLIPEAWAPEIIEWVKVGPMGCGLDRANWTYPELAQYLYLKKGLKVGRTTMQVFCKKYDIRPYRPTYKYLRGDPEKQAQAKKELEELKKKQKRGK